MNNKLKSVLKIITTIVITLSSLFGLSIMFFTLLLTGASHMMIMLLPIALISIFSIILIWKFSKKLLKNFSFIFISILLISSIYTGIQEYEKSLIINTSPNINTSEYLPFDENSKIVKLDSSTLKLTDDLPIVDGAAAVFPVYSAFVNAVYPDTTKLYDDTFKYNNTSLGYKLLAEKEIDVFFGAYPSEEQIEYAKSLGVEFEYTPIGYEAFVFFVHKNNPIDNLSTEEIQSIYSGEITNWKNVGGKNKEIVAYQRNEGSGSQSMLIRFMDGKKIMKAPSEQVNDMMSGIIEMVSNYKSDPTSIGFSFRYYVEGIIKNPNIKLISIDGIAPTVENIQNNEYPIITNLYAVTYKGNDNENVDKLINWVLSEEGQYIIKETGYVPIK